MLSQFPTDDNDQKKGRKRKREEKEGEEGEREKNKIEAEEVKIIKKNCGIKGRKEEGEAIAVWEEDMGVY